MDIWEALKLHRNTSLNPSFGVEHGARDGMEMTKAPLALLAVGADGMDICILEGLID